MVPKNIVALPLAMSSEELGKYANSIVTSSFPTMIFSTVFSMAIDLAEHMTFTQGRIKLDGSFIWNELLPEPPEEEAKVGEKPFSWVMQSEKYRRRFRLITSPFDR